MKRKTYSRGLLAALLIALLVVYLLPSPRQQDASDGWQASSFNPAPGGTKAVYLALKELDWPVERWRLPWRQLAEEDRTGGLLVLTRQPLASHRDISPQEQTLLLEWVGRGNHLLLLGEFWEDDDGRRLLGELGLDVTDAYQETFEYDRSAEILGFKRDEQELRPAAGLPAVAGRKLVSARCPPLPATRPGTELTPLWKLPNGTGIARRSWGDGTVTLSMTSSLIDNEYVARADNLEFLLWLLQPQGRPVPFVLFDETRHGFIVHYPVGQLLEVPAVRMIGALIVLGLILFLVSQRPRWGQIIPLQRQATRSTREFVASMAKLYRRADLRNATVKFLFDQTHQMLLRYLELPRHASHALIAQRLAALHPELPKWKKLAVRFDGDKFTHGLPPNSWLKASQQLIQIQHTIS
ncbi:MAG: DUF4350 domain-containing protein [Verrucomicrobiota bacterium]